MLYLEDIKNEAEASAVIPELECQAIEATEALSNKRNKIQRAERDLKCLQKLCIVRKWKAPQDALQSMLDRLGESKAELSNVNLWRA